MIHSITKMISLSKCFGSVLFWVGTQPWGKWARATVLMARTRLIHTLLLRHVNNNLSSKVCFYFDFILIPEFVVRCKFVCLMQSETKRWKHWNWKRRKFYCRVEQEEQVTHVPQNPKLLKGFNKAFSKARWGSRILGMSLTREQFPHWLMMNSL